MEGEMIKGERKEERMNISGSWVTYHPTEVRLVYGGKNLFESNINKQSFVRKNAPDIYLPFAPKHTSHVTHN